MVQLDSAHNVLPKQPMNNQDKTDIKSTVIALPESGIGDRIRDAREKRGLSQEGLSRLTKMLDVEKQGISRTVLTGYEKGKFKPGTRELRILYQALGLTPNWLILGQHDPERLRALKAQYGTEEEFENELLKAIKKLDSDSLNGVAHLIFMASTNADELEKQLSSFSVPMFKAVDALTEEFDALKKDKQPEEKNKKSKLPPKK